MDITIKQKEELFMILRQRFEKNMSRHEGISWSDVQAKLELNRAKLYPLFMMEISGGEPDVIDYYAKAANMFFVIVLLKVLKVEEVYATTEKP